MGLELDPAAHRGAMGRAELDLTDVEFALLQALMRSAGEVVAREQLAEAVLGRKFHPFDRSLDMHVSRLRHKLDASGQFRRPSEDHSRRRLSARSARPCKLAGEDKRCEDFSPNLSRLLDRESLTFVISTMLILQHRFVGAHEIVQVLNTTLPSTVGAAVNAYETGGCAGLHQYGASIQQSIYLADTPKHFLCGAALSPATAAALTAADTKPGVYTNLDGDDYLWSTAIQSAGGRRYLFLLSRPRTPTHFIWAICFISRFPSCL